MNLGYAISLHLNSNEQLSEKEKQIFSENILKQYQFAEKLNKYFQSTEMNALLKYRKGEMEIYKLNYEDASQLFKEAEKDFSEIGLIQWEVHCLLSRAQNEYLNKNYPLALELLQKAENLSIKHDFNEQLVYVYELINEIYDKKGDKTKAYEYLKKFNEISIKQAEINSKDKIKAIELEQKISENQHLFEKYENERKTYIILFAFSLFFLILTLGLFYSINQNKKRKISNIEKDKLIAEIELKNHHLQEELLKEKVKFNQEYLITFANQADNIDKFLERLKSQIKKLPQNHELKEEINELKLLFSEILGDQNQLKQINSMNSEINQDFFLEVRKKYPNLTKSEEQLLSFLIRDMTSKEISDILKITVESVHKKRYRLRKKLAMENDETFLYFYKKIIA